MKRVTLIISILAATSMTQMRAESVTLQQMQAATSMQMQIAADVCNGVLTPQDALKRLHEAGALSTGYAAKDIGQRLIAMRQPDLAHPFFEAAERALEQRVRQLGRGATKAQDLQSLAWIRAHFLGKTEQAARDLDEALALKPDDLHLHSLKLQIAVKKGDRAEVMRQEQQAWQYAKKEGQR